MAKLHEQLVRQGLTEIFDGIVQSVANILEASGPSEVGGAKRQFQLKSACEYLDMGETKFRELVESEEIPRPYDSGGRNHWLKEDLDQYAKRAAQQRKRTWRQEHNDPTAASGCSSPSLAKGTRSASGKSRGQTGKKSKGGSSD